MSASQLLRLYGDPKLFTTITAASLQSVRKKVDERLTEKLVAEYSLGYTLCGDTSSAQHRGMQILTDLRAHQKNLFIVAKLTAAVVATSGLATKPRALLNAKTELEGAGVAVTSEIHVCAVESAKIQSRVSRLDIVLENPLPRAQLAT